MHISGVRHPRSSTANGISPLLTPERLEALVAGGETSAVEFKGEAAGRLADRDLVETVVCLANRSDTGPGWLLIRSGGRRPREWRPASP